MSRDTSPDAMQRVNAGSDQQHSAVVGIHQRMDAEAVDRREQQLLPPVPEDHRKIAAQLFQKRRSEALIKPGQSAAVPQSRPRIGDAPPSNSQSSASL